MQSAWWQLRQWQFKPDMDGDGAVTSNDLPLVAEWLFFLPGDAFIAQFGATPLGQSLQLTPASFGSLTSAAISVVLWLLAIGALIYLRGFCLDAWDPTSRQQQREYRKAAARAQRAYAEERARLKSSPWRRALPPRPRVAGGTAPDLPIEPVWQPKPTAPKAKAAGG